MANHETGEVANSNEEEWKYLDQSISEEHDNTEEKGLDAPEIPVESALDEVDAYVDDSYNDILNDKINQSSSETTITANNRGTVMDEIEVEMKENEINFEGELLSESEVSGMGLVSDVLEGELEHLDDLDSILTSDNEELDRLLAEMQDELPEQPVASMQEVLPEEISEEIPVEVVSEEMLENLVEDIAENSEEELVEERTEEPEANLVEEMPEEIEEGLLEEIDDTPEQELLEDLAEDIDIDLPEELLEELEADLPEELLEDVEVDLSEELPEENSVVNEEELSDTLSDEVENDPVADLLKEIDDVLPDSFTDEVDEDGLMNESMKQVEPLEETLMSLEEFDALLGDIDEQEPGDISMPKTASDVFSDSLGAVSSLEDQELEETFNSLLPDMEEAKEQEVPKTLMQKMFANIEPENPEEEIAAYKESLEQKEEKKKAKAEEKAKKKEEKKKAAEEKKAAKAAEKDAKAKAKAEKKAELKAKKQKEKEEAEKNYVPEGKINKVGASIVFGLAAIVGITIVIGAFRGSNSLTVDTAKFNAQIGRYKQAYEELNGLDLSGSDKEVYEKVNTVMLISKQKNSYENFTELGMHVEALDSLLKGLERYDQYYDQAKKYGVTDQYDKLKSKFLAELNKTYGVNNEEARILIDEKDPTAYTKALSKICSSKTSVKDDTNKVANAN